ncbi:siroheme decarboxylase subunit beta [Piscinibacter defluvii]|uniref:siroheme decarboxylase subunit beta n=1 Tax=Piscinibacter defluvii TaxID=1796922 RepID=UPI000FDD2D26|nr:Lrp/AsnC family transcriptional regulator [Piscinibacter defluvii]
MDLRDALIDGWQRGFPLVREPFAAIADRLGAREVDVLRACTRLHEDGVLGRIGGLFGAGAGGAGALAALAVPRERLAEVAARVSARPGVNHNYEREHRWNLWFVVHAADAEALARTLDAIGHEAALPMLRLPMRRAYRIDLGFDRRGAVANAVTTTRGEAPAPLAEADWPLAARVEAGLPLVPRPFDTWAAELGQPPAAVLGRLRFWLLDGTLRRFGLVVRHHELGFDANAMAVFAPPEECIDACGAALARESGVTLAYRRECAPGWPYTLYAMLHGRDRTSVRALAAEVIERSGLSNAPHELLFSVRRFKQTGARRFRAMADAL